MFTPCTTMRRSSNNTLITSPRLPLSSRRPLMTSTVSPLRILTLILKLLNLQHFRGQGNDLHVALFTKLSGNGTKNTSAFRVDSIGIQDHRSVVIKANVRAI